MRMEINMANKYKKLPKLRIGGAAARYYTLYSGVVRKFFGAGAVAKSAKT